MKRGNPMYAKMMAMAQAEDHELEEARTVKRSKNRAIVATMDAIKEDMTKAGWKHRQMGSVDLYSRKSTDQEKTAKTVEAILKKHNLKGFHNREDDDYETKWTFEHPRHRQFLAFLTAHKSPGDKGHMGLHVQDQAMVR
jgi:hypothetical protein